MPRKQPVKSKKLPPGQEKHVKLLIKAETTKTLDKRYFDINQSALACSGTAVGYYDLLTGIIRGDTIDDFASDTLRIEHLDIRFHLAHYDSSNSIRIMIFQWKSTSPSVTSIIESESITSGLVYLGPYEKDWMGYMDVLYDKTFDSTTYTDSSITRRFQCKPKLLVRFTESGVLNKNGVYIAYMSDSAAAPHPTLDFVSRITYYE